ncbi:MAG TPA: amino acid permease [Solirubrobacterales bacterium]|jgi:amino acid transporter|nr:amino acid permease [Solirubrobacterales bacterium]
MEVSNKEGVTPVGEQAYLAEEDGVVSKFGYKQELNRTLRFFSLFAVAFSVVSISTGLFLNYGFAINSFGPASIWTWPIAAVGQIVMALIIAELATKIPLAGYAYQWGGRLVGTAYGWFVAAFALVYMLVTVGAISLLGVAPLLFTAAGINESRGAVLAVAGVLLIAAIVINLISVKFASRVNNLAVFAEIAGTMTLAIVLLILWGIHSGDADRASLSILTNSTRTITGSGFYCFTLAGLIGIYTLVGFELSADLSEEAVDSQKGVPRGIIAGVAISAVLGMIALISFTLSITNLKAAQESSQPLVTIAEAWLPTGVVRVFVFLVAFSMFALVVITIAAAGRLVFSLSRDNLLPASRHLATVDPKTKTPIKALVTCGVIMLALMLYGYFQSDAFATLIGATSLAPYVVYLLIVGAYIRGRPTLAEVEGGFNLGRWGPPLMVFGLVWIICAILVLAIPSQFHGADKIVVGGGVVAAVWYFLVLRGRIAKGTAGVNRYRAGSEEARAVESMRGTTPG